MGFFLARLPVFKKLPQAALEGLTQKLILKRYGKNEPVFEEGGRADAVYLLRSGLIKAVKYSPRAEPASMEIIAPGQLFGMIAVLDDKPYPVSAVPLRESEAYRIPGKVFSVLMETHADFAKQVYASVGDHLRQAQALRALSKEPVERRVAHILCTLSASMGKDLAIRREEIGELAGCTQETAIRTLAGFRKKRLISSGWKRITVLEPERLKRIAERS